MGPSLEDSVVWLILIRWTQDQQVPGQRQQKTALEDRIMRRYSGNVGGNVDLHSFRVWDAYVDLLFVLFICSYDFNGGLISNASSCHVS